MSKTFNLISDLRLCYEAKAPNAEDWVKMTKYERNLLCNDVRTALINYMKSEEYCFYDILKNKVETIEKDDYSLMHKKKMFDIEKKADMEFNKSL